MRNSVKVRNKNNLDNVYKEMSLNLFEIWAKLKYELLKYEYAWSDNDKLLI